MKDHRLSIGRKFERAILRLCDIGLIYPEFGFYLGADLQKVDQAIDQRTKQLPRECQLRLRIEARTQVFGPNASRLKKRSPGGIRRGIRGFQVRTKAGDFEFLGEWRRRSRAYFRWRGERALRSKMQT